MNTLDFCPFGSEALFIFLESQPSFNINSCVIKSRTGVSKTFTIKSHVTRPEMTFKDIGYL